jgi:hypothetical protein
MGALYYQKRGSAVCGNSLVMRQEIADGAVLDTIHRALDPRVIEDAIEAAVDMLIANRTNHSTDRIAIEREIAESRSAQRRLLDAIKRSNQSLDTLVQELQTEETRMRLLQRQVGTLANCERAAVLDRGRLGQVLRARAADVKAVLSRHTQEARKALQLFSPRPAVLHADGAGRA